MLHDIGIDEAGRGPWAGPVCAGAVCFLDKSKLKDILPLLNDSKKLNRKARESIFGMLLEKEREGCLAIGFGLSTSDKIDEVGIRESNRLAMEKALKMVMKRIGGKNADRILIDGKDNYSFRGIINEIRYIVRGDSLIDEIKAASIVAKVRRDMMMAEYDSKYPGYSFGRHAGYGTRMHSDSIDRLGICPIHRKTFKPIKNRLILKQKALEGPKYNLNQDRGNHTE